MLHYVAAEEQHPLGGQDPEKRRQVLSGAREVFLANGFDGASMGEIARAAGVSKGTLYVYFGSKQDLFAALVREESARTAELTFILDDENADLAEALTKVGRSYVEAMIRPEHLATVRTVIAVAEKFPEVGKVFLSSGPEAGVARLAAWLRVKIARGELDIPNPELAAWTFLVGCHSPIVMPMLFAGEGTPQETCVSQIVEHAVDLFLRAFRPRPPIA